MALINDKPGPIEVWLTKSNIEVTCTVYFEDETGTSIDIDALSIGGAEREITRYLIGQGYTPVGRWSTEDEDENEVSRTFRPAKETS